MVMSELREATKIARVHELVAEISKGDDVDAAFFKERVVGHLCLGNGLGKPDGHFTTEEVYRLLMLPPGRLLEAVQFAQRDLETRSGDRQIVPLPKLPEVLKGADDKVRVLYTYPDYVQHTRARNVLEARLLDAGIGGRWHTMHVFETDLGHKVLPYAERRQRFVYDHVTEVNYIVRHPDPATAKE